MDYYELYTESALRVLNLKRNNRGFVTRYSQIIHLKVYMQLISMLKCLCSATFCITVSFLRYGVKVVANDVLACNLVLFCCFYSLYVTRPPRCPAEVTVSVFTADIAHYLNLDVTSVI